MLNLGKLTVQLLLIIAIWILAESIQALLLPFIPAHIVGLIILLILLYGKILPFDYIRYGANFLLAHMSLLFIPPVVGIIQHKQTIIAYGLPLIVISIISPIIMFFVLGHSVRWLCSIEAKWRK